MMTSLIHVDCNWLASQITDRSSRGIALTVAELIQTGVIMLGSQLPTVRELAEPLGVSQATVSVAWGLLRKQRLVSGNTRKGSWVCGRLLGPKPERIYSLGNFTGVNMLDLVWSIPDPMLLPDFKQALLYCIQVDQLHHYQRIPIIPELEQQVRRRWPYPAEMFLTSNGAFDGLNIILHSLLLPGSTIAIEVPTTLMVLDLLDQIDAKIIPIPCDKQGPLPSALQQALDHNPVAFIYQSGIHVKTGHSVTSKRIEEMASLLRTSNMLIIEKDGIGELSSKAVYSLGHYLSERTLHIRSYSKAYSPDLRLAVISGSEVLLKRVHAFQQFGSGWSSRFLQGVLAWLIQDPHTQDTIAYAWEIYCQRRKALADALIQRGVAVGQHDGLGLWLAVPSEQYAVTTLAAHCMAVLPGNRCGNIVGQYIRVSTGLLKPEQVDKVADAIALVYE